MDILIDTNVLIDFLDKREPYLENAKALFQICYEKKINGFISALSIPNIWYILRKSYSEKIRRTLLLSLFDFFNVIGVEPEMLITALEKEDFSDFEDCIQAECAEKIKVDFIITRNTTDYETSKISALTPEAFLAGYK